VKTRVASAGRHAGSRGFSLPALMAMLAVMAIALSLALPSWTYLNRNDKEEELIFRGRQISNAIARFQRKNGNALPVSFEQLVQGKYLRKAYKDPMSADGKWRILRPGEGGPRPPTRPPLGGSAQPTPSPAPSSTPPVFGGNSGTQTGPIAGVSSLSAETGLRLVNGSQTYSQWVFAPNVPLLVGGQSAGRAPGPGAQLPAQSILRGPDREAPRLSR
jgi:type II secretory pathway pseudopilin PulG